MTDVSLLLADVHVLGVDHLVARRTSRSARPRPTRPASTRSGSRRPLRLLLVHHLGELMRGLGEPLAGLLHGVGVVALQGLARLGQGLLELPLLGGAQLLLVLVVGLLGVVDQTVQLVPGLDLPAALLVLLAVRLGLLDHAVDVVVGEARDRKSTRLNSSHL